jgi:two-component system chemotaxis response regulator CheY
MAFNILVVDDSAVMRQMVMKAVRMSGVEVGEVHQAANGREGLDVLSRNWIDLVLLDLNMPVMNGEEMIEQMRAIPETKSLPVVVVSTERSRTRLERLRRWGVWFVRKPFAPETVRTIIQEATGVTHEQPV